MPENEVLLGLHNSEYLETYEDFFKCATKYSTDSAKTYEEMLKKVREKEYKIYIMDLNLGKPMSEDITPAVEIYNLIKSRVERGLAKFIAISGDWMVVESAQKRGIPAEVKGDFSLRDFCKEK